MQWGITLAFGPALILGGPGVFSDTSNFVGTEAELTTAADLGPLMIVAILSGPLTYALIAILVIALTSGKAGLRDLRARGCSTGAWASAGMRSHC